MNSRLNILISAILLIVVFGLATSGFSASVTLRQASLFPENSNYGRAANRFAELVSKYTNGEINVTVFHGGQLGNRNVVSENIFKGGVDIWLECLDVFATYVEEVYFAGMPYLYRDLDHMRSFMKSDWFEKNVHAKFIEKGATFVEGRLSWVRGPFRVLVANTPVLTVDDLKKIKMRVYPSEVYIKSWQALGVNAVAMEWNDVYLALRQNMIQGVASPMDLVRPMKFTEVAKYIIQINEFPQILEMVVNKRNYDRLTLNQKKSIQQANEEAGDYFTKMNFEGVEIDLAYMQEQDGATFIRPPLKQWREKISPFYGNLEKEGKIAKGFYNMVQSLK